MSRRECSVSQGFGWIVNCYETMLFKGRPAIAFSGGSCHNSASSALWPQNQSPFASEAEGGREMEAEKIELKFVETKFLCRRSCTICGGHTEKDYVLVEAEIPGGTVRGCWRCLKGDNADNRGCTVDERLAKHAERLEDYARHIRSLVGRVRVPSFQAWQAEEKRVEQRLMRDIDEAIWGKLDASLYEEEPGEFVENGIK